MKHHLNESLFGLVIRQFKEHFLFYAAALLCLYATHWIGSHLPFFAKELAEAGMKGISRIDTAKFFWLALGIIVFRTSSRLLFFYPARIMQKQLRVELLALTESAPPTRYAHYSDGQLFQVLFMDMEQVRALIGFALLQVGNIIIALMVLIPKLSAFNGKLLMALLPMPLAFVIFSLFVSRTSKFFRKVQDAQGEVQNFLIESYAGKKTIQNYHAEKSFIDLFKVHSMKELEYFFKAGLRVSYTLPLMPLGVGLSLLWGGHIIFQEGLGTSALVLFSGFIFLFMEPLAYVSWIGIVISRTVGSWSRIRELTSHLERTSHQEEVLLQKNPQNFSSCDLNFNLEFWGHPLELYLKRGSWTVLVGKTGAGKTYIIKQVADLLKLKKINISYVSQSPYLYNDTILKNIFLGKMPSADDEDAAFELLQLFGLDFLENNRENLFKLEVGENGKRLSGGQAKRLCLVRTLMSCAEVIIWDDPFSSVDLILEKEIVSKLRNHPRYKGLTILLSSHRLSTVRLSDEVIYVEKEMGILESGSINQLLEEDTKVYEYFKNQMV